MTEKSNGAAAGPPLVLLVCPGLDHARRGFETFARECFEALHGRCDLRIELVKGSGSRAMDELAVPTLRREAAGARWLARRRGVPPFVVEHAAFSLALIPLLLRRRPDVIYFSEWHVGTLLARWRRLSGQRFALVMCNGSATPGGYAHLERVQQLVPGAIEYTVARGEPSEGQLLLPLGFDIEASLPPLPSEARRALRASLGLPEDAQIVLSVGAVNSSHKRMDYLVEEIARCQGRPFLVILGQEEGETPAIRRLAAERLGPERHMIRSVMPERIGDYYRAADAFVLASHWESFGRVLVEALANGLPCLAHDHPVMRWVVGDAGETRDLGQPGAVAGWVVGLSAADLGQGARARRHRRAYERFGWRALADDYVAMLVDAAAQTDRASGHPRVLARTISRVLPTTRAGAPAATE